MVMLRRPGEAHGSIPNLDGGRLKLVHTLKYQGRPIFQDRRWGDVGMMELAFDVDDLAQTVETASWQRVPRPSCRPPASTWAAARPVASPTSSTPRGTASNWWRH